jgi:hypothetical protein
MTKKKQLTVFFEDIAKTMVKFPEDELAETKREIFNLVNRREIELPTQKQIHMLSYPHQYQHMPSTPVHQINYFSKDSFPNEPPTNSQGSKGSLLSAAVACGSRIQSASGAAVCLRGL